MLSLLIASLSLLAPQTPLTSQDDVVWGITSYEHNSSYPASMELSNDNGRIENGYVFVGGNGSRMACKYDLPGSGYRYLTTVKYYTKPNWPNTAFEGFGVCCWKYINNLPGAIIWPGAGQYVYNHNTGGGWITQSVAPAFDLQIYNSFLVGIWQLYNYPSCDSFGYDDRGANEQDWANPAGSGWSRAPYGHGTARAVLSQSFSSVETTTIGSIRALYR